MVKMHALLARPTVDLSVASQQRAVHFSVRSFGCALFYFQEGQIMPDYQKMYTTLFNAITDALEEIEKQNIGLAREQLMAAQQKTEEIYIES